MKWKLLILPVLFGLVAVVFHFLGNTADIDYYGKSLFVWLFRRWLSQDGKFAYAFFVPLVSAWLIWKKRKRIAVIEGTPDYRGLVVVSAALLLQALAYRARLPRLSVLSLIGLLWGIPSFIYGKELGRILFFPCVYLVFCIPLTFLDVLTFPLRMFGAEMSALLLRGLGIQAVQSGTAIYLLDHGGFGLDVADPCSGLKYLISLTALAGVYAYLAHEGLIRRWILFLSAVPLAIAANVIRIVALAFVAVIGGPEAAESAYHDFSGYIVFASAVLMLAALSALIRSSALEKITRWRRRN